jgi:2-C-methyl-D-erythritol 4-phosphate cytidylyltransferase
MHSKEKPKQFLDLYNKPIIIYTLEHFENNPEIDAVVVACVEEWIPFLNELLYKFRIEKVKKIVPGGKTGQESIYNGLMAAAEVSGEEDTIVLVHDGVRPLINTKLLSECIQSVKEKGSAITAGIVKETIAVISPEGCIEEVPLRERSRVAKAPQCFWLKDILNAHRRALAEDRHDFIDSCTMMQHYGYKLFMVDGPYENIKITTPDDYYTMRAIIEAKENSQIYGLE